jgi:hypothetical protein
VSQQIKIIVPWTGRSVTLVTGDYPDELLRYAGYADAPQLNAGAWADLLASGRTGDAITAAKKFRARAEPLSADFVATESALHYVHPFASQYYRFLWSDITAMEGHTFGRREARQAGRRAPGTWIDFCVAGERIEMRVDDAYGPVLPQYRLSRLASG